MRTALVVVALFAVAAAMPLMPETAGNPEKFVIDHDPVEAGYNSSSPLWTMFKQCDSKWAGNKLGTCSLTICQAGCAMSSVAMILNTRGVNVNPGSLNSWLASHGGYESGCDIIWSKVDAFGKTKFLYQKKASEAELCDDLRKDYAIVANVRNGQHWVLLTGCRGGGVFSVNDPGFNQDTYTIGDIVTNSFYN